MHGTLIAGSSSCLNTTKLLTIVLRLRSISVINSKNTEVRSLGDLVRDDVGLTIALLVGMNRHPREGILQASDRSLRQRLC